jgi:hypothetical protein
VRASFRPSLEELERRVLLSTNVLTYHNDNSRTGQDLTETTLTPNNVNVNDFGKLFTLPVDGNVYAQPLMMSDVAIPGKGIHDVLFVATEHDSVYAFDADTPGAPLWQDSFINPAAGITTIPWQDINSNLIYPEQGITGTPVIDPSTNTLYVVAATKEVSGNTVNYFQRLHALDLTTGAEKFGGPVVIQATVSGTGQGGTQVTFLPLWQLERSGLLLDNGVVYTSWASQDDNWLSRGWIIGYNATTLQQTGAFCTTPNGVLGTLWGAGEGGAADGSGNIYVATGNGTFDTTTPRVDYGDSMLKLTPSLQVSDFFTPSSQGSENGQDLDFGSGGWMLLPDEAGSSAHPHLAVTEDKSGRIFLINRDNMGQYDPNTDHVVEELNGVLGGGYGFSVPAYFNHTIYWADTTAPLMAFSIDNGFMSTSPTSVAPTPMPPGGGASISANGTANGIVWVIDNGGYYYAPQYPGVLHAYDASDLAHELYNSNQAGTRDQMGIPIKFAVPTVANGHVYVGGLNSVTVYGLLANEPPAFSDPSFAQPAVGTGPNAYQYDPTGVPWAFSGNWAGVAGNGSTLGNPDAPSGTQAGFLQKAGGSISQAATFPTNGTYNISFLAAQKPGNQETFQLQLDGNVIGTFNNYTSTAYSALSTNSFAVTAGVHTLTFAGTDLNANVNGDDTVFIDQVIINPVAPAFNDPGFEQPPVGTGSSAYQYDPTGAPWTYTGIAGVVGNGSAFGDPTAPQGTQAAFLQMGGGSISQSVNFQAGGTYAITFMAAQRANNHQTFNVLFDGDVVGIFENFNSNTYVPLSTDAFSASPGSHTITIEGTNLAGGDNTVFIDQTGISQVSPPVFSDPGFEQPPVGSGAYQFDPTGAPWTYSGPAGLVGNGSAYGNSAAPEGNQAAFLQNAGGTISQSITFATGGNYTISFLAAQRLNNHQTFEVLLDGTVVGIFDNFNSPNYTRLTTDSFAVTPGTHTITFEGTDLDANINNGDNTIFIDQAAINLVLAPAFVDPGFEQPPAGVGANAFQYDPTGDAWIYMGATGVVGNGSNYGNPNAPQGTQAAFLQGSQASVSQSIVVEVGGTYAINFFAAQRMNDQQTFEVLLDGNVIGDFDNYTSTSYSLLTTNTFAVTAGVHSISFQATNLDSNLNNGDNTVFIDESSIVSMAMPAVSDPAFEQPTLAPGTYQYDPMAGNWSFAGIAGVLSNGSAFGNQASPAGTQAAFLQKAGGTINQEVSFAVSGNYTISFMAAERTGNQETFQVLLDGNVVGTFDNLTSGSYSLLTTNTFSVTTGVHVLSFIGTNLNSNVDGGDNTVFIDQPTINPMAPVFNDPGFEQPPVGSGPNAFQYDPSGAPWSYAGSAGVVGNGSNFGNSNAPQGTQAAFLQGSGGTISQAVTFTAGGTYTVSFEAAQRPGNQQTFEVLLDGNVVGTFNNLTSASYTPLSTASFTVASGVHTLAFEGTNINTNVNGGDNTVFLDQAATNAVPPALNDSDFAAPAIGTGSGAYVFDPQGAPWTYAGGAGLVGNGSIYNNPSSPQGSQAAFLQGTGGSITQAVNFTSGGTFTVSFQAAQRANNRQTFEILVDGNIISSFNSFSSNSYTALNSASFTVSAGIHTLAFASTNLNGGDNTVFLDQINFNLAP